MHNTEKATCTQTSKGSQKGSDGEEADTEDYISRLERTEVTGTREGDYKGK